VGDFIMLQILEASHGTAITVTDSELMQGVGELARLQGLHCAPEGGAVWMAARQLLASGWINPSETVVLFNTGAAVKYNHLLRCVHALRLNCNDPRALDNLETAL
jgi:threonine synthase